MARKVAKGEFNLTEWQKQFCQRYIVHLNATKAYLEAYPNANQKHAGVHGHNTLKLQKVQDYIEHLMEKRNKRNEVTADQVVQELARIGFFNPKTMYDEHGVLKNVLDMDDDTAKCISRIDQDVVLDGQERTVLRTKYHLHSKISALDALAKHTGIYFKDNEQKRSNIVQFIIPDNGRDNKDRPPTRVSNTIPIEPS